MTENFQTPGNFGLENHGLTDLRNVYWNLHPAKLVDLVIQRHEATVAENGAVVVNTLPCTGRSPNDKFIEKDPNSKEDLVFWGKTNRPVSPEQFDRLYAKVIAYLQGRDVFVQDMAAGAFPAYRLPIRVVTESAWQSLFARNLFLRLTREEQIKAVPEFTIIVVPGLHAVPKTDGTKSDVFILLSFSRRLVLIGGTRYAGEVKKSVFTVMNYLMPLQGVLSMHCSANVGKEGDVALFFGLSGTGKTTLSSDPDRHLIGDDEHGWGDEGIFNFEGGCYAKTINLRQELEPLIWQATRQFGAVLENVVMDPETGKVDFSDSTNTENTRGAYPLDFVENHVPEGYAGQPQNIFFLTADASGVLPPLAKLPPQQAMYYFLSGYTSKLAGTEKGLGAEPQSTFSTCFGAPFLPLNPNVYAKLLGEKIARHQVNVWLINTGWTGGPYGVGKRIYLPYTRAMVRAALTGQLDNVATQVDPFFGLEIPLSCPEVPDQVLNPRETWADPQAYDLQAQKLIGQFIDNFTQFASYVETDVVKAGPQLDPVAKAV